MFSFSRRTRGPLYGALIDVGSGTIGVAVVASNLGKQLPTILYQNRVTMRVGKNAGGSDESLRRVREMLLTTSLMLSEEGGAALRTVDSGGRITELCITVSSPWSYTVVQKVNYHEDETFKVTSGILQDLVETAEASILESVRKESGGGKEGFEVVEHATVGVSINEYPVENPLRLQGTSLDLAQVAGVIPGKIMESVAEIQEKLFPKTRLHAHTSMLAMYSVLADLFPRTHTFGIIDVTADATEFGIIEDDTLIANSFIRNGTNSFLKSVMARAERPLADIETNLRTFGDSSVTKDKDVLAGLAEYSEHVREGVEAVLGERAFPAQIVVIAHEPYREAFTDAVLRGVRAATKRKPNVVAVDAHLIKEICHGTGDDVYLALAARFFHKLHAREEDTGD